MDLTWDDTSDNWYGDLDQRHLYFGLTDELMAIAHSDHTAYYKKNDYTYRSTDLSNNYFVRNGKADEWAEKYAGRIQQHLDAKEESFSIDADNQSFPPSISGIQNGIVAHAMNQREWNANDVKVELIATSRVITQTNNKWLASYDFTAKHNVPAPPPSSPARPGACCPQTTPPARSTAGSAYLGHRRDERAVDAPVALEDVLGEEAARPELRDPQIEHIHACHEAASVAVPIVGPIAAEPVNLGVHDGGNHLHGKQHEQRLDVNHPVRQLRHRYGPGIASDSISIAVTALSQNPYFGIPDS